MASISATSFYGARARAQHERGHMPPREINLNGSDVESEIDEDELEVFEEEESEESDYSSETESEDEENSGEENTVQSNVAGTSGAKDTSKGNQSLRWRKRETVQYNTTYKGEPFPPPPEPDMTPFQYFKQMVDDQLINHIVEQTNLYSVQSTGTSIAVDHNEMEQYIGLLVMMSIIKLPQIRMYWAKETRVPCIADVMSINRFEKIKQFFHCNDNEKILPPTADNFDKLYKVRPVIDSLLEKCKQIPQEEHHSVDEQIIPTKSRTSLRQYLPNKPNKWGIKVWARCGISGILYDFEIYTGRTDKAQTKPELLMGGNVVNRLTRTLPMNVNCKVYFDNFFSSIALMNSLKEDGLWSVATIRKDRLKGADKLLLSEKDLKKKGRGAFDSVVEANSGVTVLRWFDNGLVQMVSNFIGNDEATQARRWSKKERKFINIQRPAMVVEYNSYMGGVDLCDMLLSMYRVRHRSTKYYMHIIFYCIGVAVVNGWLLYRRHMHQKRVPQKKHMPLISFQSAIAASLCQAGKTSTGAARSRGRPSSSSPTPVAMPSKKRKSSSVPNPVEDVRLDQCGHFPVYEEKQQRCRLCKTGYSHLKCCKCQVHLCLVKSRNCFNSFHGL